MYLLEGRSLEKPVKLSQFVESLFYAHRMDDEQLNDWCVYVSDRRVENLSKVIRPKSKIVLVKKTESAPELNIVYEDKNLIILNKPHGLSTQKTLKSYEDNLYDQVRYYYCHQKNFPVGMPYVGLHHRLDRDTSGLVIMTKQRSANKEVGDLFKNKTIRKEYLAITEAGEKAPPKKWREKNKIGRAKHPKHRFYFQVQKKGDEAISDFEYIKDLEGTERLVRCFPVTGRTHQLRVHLSNCGWPILGDRLYGNKKKAKRLMLHARKLSFKFKGEEICIETPDPWAEL